MFKDINEKVIIRTIEFMVIDIISILMSLYLSQLLRFDFHFDAYFLPHFNFVAPFIVVTSIIIFFLCSLYSGMWKYASIIELKNIIIAAVVSSLLLITLATFTGNNLPRSCYILYGIILAICLCASRYAYRILRALKKEYIDGHNKSASRVMIVGAGEAGEAILKEITNNSRVNKKVVCFIDDNKSKKNLKIHGITVKGNRNDIIEVSEDLNVDEIIIALPTATQKDIADILQICKETKCKIQRVPGIYQLINHEVSLASLREVNVLDLLGRDQIEVNLDEIKGYIKDQVVMVTGGGGSIGSELCRQIAKSSPKQLIIVDIYENNAYDIQLELQHDYPDLKLETIIASVRNSTRMEHLFETYHPDIVYHAAAHKHVPLMEDSPCEAIKNNVFGTLNCARAANKYHAKKFVLISTDKAVNPTNVMGATKRICEMIIQSFNEQSKTEFVAVRFGNVLGSNGSVIPLFKKQIAAGGPVTVTHPDIIRYFMTIPEAVSLVLQAGAYAKGGEIFVLDMGEPVKILDMAKNLIKLSGYEPDVDIKIEFTGLRPGEKLYEELLMSEEGMKSTQNKSIFIGQPIKVDIDTFIDQLDHLKEIAYTDTTDIRKYIKEIVSTYNAK